MGTEQHLSCADSPGTHHLGLGRGYLKKVRLEIISHSLGCYWWKLRARLSSGGDRSLVLEAVKLIRRCHCQLSRHTFQFSFPRVKSASFTKIHSCTGRGILLSLLRSGPQHSILAGNTGERDSAHLAWCLHFTGHERPHS